MEHNGKQDLLDRRYLRMARIWAENSYCERRKVGALMVKGRTIISDGFNGASRRSQRHNQSGPFKQFGRGFDALRHRVALSRLCQTHHPGRNKESGFQRTLPHHRRH